MIIIGYQGVGKSTLANKKDKRYIDLESGNFFVNDKRDKNWYKVYINIAYHLSKQGYTVFVSSHKEVRNELKEVVKYHNEDVRIIYPSLDIKDEWINKLESRYNSSNLSKDYKAWKNAETMYKENIIDLMNEIEFKHIVIQTLDYDLEKLVEE